MYNAYASSLKILVSTKYKFYRTNSNMFYNLSGNEDLDYMF